jgi:SAM-dependent methyltransferase
MSNEIEVDYRQEIYKFYLGKDTDVDVFINNWDRVRVYRQFQGWWGKFLPSEKHLPILDVGCGYGGFLAFLQSKGYTDLTGVDSSPQQVEIAHKLGLANVSVDDVFNALTKHQNYYSCISAFNVLEHLDKEKVLPFLKLAKSALRNDGCLLLEIPNANGLFGGRTRYWDFTHELSFTPTCIVQIMKVVGFTKVEFQERKPVLHGIKSQVRLVLWTLIHQVLSLYLMIEQGNAGYKIFTQDMHVIVKK